MFLIPKGRQASRSLELLISSATSITLVQFSMEIMFARTSSHLVFGATNLDFAAAKRSSAEAISSVREKLQWRVTAPPPWRARWRVA